MPPREQDYDAQYTAGDEENQMMSKADEKEPMEEEEDDDEPESRGYACLSITSNFFFTLAAALYVVIINEDFQWYKHAETIPAYVWEADDWYTWYPYYQDDALFQVGSNEGGWVTRYQILYFCAAMGFVIVGILEFIKVRNIFGVVFFVAGCFGVASAMFMIRNERISIILNSVSVHLYAVEAVLLFIKRDFAGDLKWIYRVADMFFVSGTIIDVVMSYYHVNGTFTLQLAKVSVAGSAFWLTTGLLYLFASIRQYGGECFFKNKDDDDDEATDQVSKPSATA